MDLDWAAIATTQRRVIDDDDERFEPLHWTPAVSFGVYWVAARAPSVELASGDDAVNIPTSGLALRRIGGATLPVGPTRVVVYRRDEAYHSEEIAGVDHQGFYLRLHPALTAQLRSTGCRVHDRPLARSDLRAWYAFARDVQAGLTDDALFDEALALLEGTFQHHSGAGAAEHDVIGPDRERVRAIERRLTRDRAAPHTQDALAADVGWSRFQLSRRFRATTGFTVHTFRERLRIARAVELMRDPALDLSEIGLEVGYTSHAHFTERFRRLLGRPPRHYRAAAAAQIR